MIYFIFSFIFALLDIWLIEFFLSRNYTLIKKDKNIYYFIEICLMVILYTSFQSNYLLNFIMTTMILALAIYKYKFTTKDLVKYMFLFLILHTLFGYIITSILIWTFNIHVDFSYISWSILYKILIGLIIRYLELLILLSITNYNTKKNIKLHNFKSFSFFLSFYLGFVLIINNDKLFIFPNVGRTFIFVIIVYNIALIFFDRFQTHHEELEYDHEQLKSESSSDSVYFEEHLKGDDEIRGIKHDMKNHLLVIHSYIDLEMKDVALRYIEQIQGEIDMASATVHTGITSVDSIITSKVKTMNKSNIKFTERYKPIYLGVVYDSDLALMIASALDNAIEAAIQSEDKVISLEISTELNYLCMTLTNSIKRNSKPNFRKSSKEDAMRHGFGYKKIKSIVKKYNGDLDKEITTDRVIMTITLKID